MSNRYLWQRNNLTTSFTNISTSGSTYRWTLPNEPLFPTNQAIHLDLGSSLNIGSNGQLECSGSAIGVSTTGIIYIPNSSVFAEYFEQPPDYDGSSINHRFDLYVRFGDSPYAYRLYGYVTTTATYVDLQLAARTNGNQSVIQQVGNYADINWTYFRQYQVVKGAANDTVSNSGASTYPPRDYVSKSARIWPYSAPGMRGSGRASTSMYPLLGAALTM